MLKNRIDISKVVLSGIKPSGCMHLGHYYGFIMYILNASKWYPNKTFIILVANLHAVSSNDYHNLIWSTRRLTLELFSFFYHHDNVYIVQQSTLPCITLLSQFFNSFISEERLKRKNRSYMSSSKHSIDVMTYPILMSADVAFFYTDELIVSIDQKQNVELIKYILKRASNYLSNINVFKWFKILNPSFIHGKTLVGIDGRKMSKSFHNTINIFDDISKIKKSILSIRTSNISFYKNMNVLRDMSIFQLYSCFYNDIHTFYRTNISYIDIKQWLLKGLIETFKDVWKTYFYYQNRWKDMYNMLKYHNNMIIDFLNGRSKFIIDILDRSPLN